MIGDEQKKSHQTWIAGTQWTVESTFGGENWEVFFYMCSCTCSLGRSSWLDETEADNARDYGRKTEKTVNVNETSYAVIAAIPTRLQTWIRISVLVVFLSLLEIYLTSRLKIVLLNNGTVYKQKSYSDDFSALSEVAGAHAWPRGQDLHLWPPEVFLLWSSRSITTPWRNVFRSANDTCKKDKLQRVLQDFQ